MARRWSLLAGAWGSLGLVAVLTTITLVQRTYLDEVNWSPVSRTPTEWPSILATGPHGWVVSVAFAVCGATTLLFAFEVRRFGAAAGSDYTSFRAVAVWISISGLGLLGVAFPADGPGATLTSWHATVHNLLYPAIPIGVLLATTRLSLTRKTAIGRSVSRALLPVMLISFGLTNVDSIAQLARYPAFGSLTVWTVALSTRLAREATLSQVHEVSGGSPS